MLLILTRMAKNLNYEFKESTPIIWYQGLVNYGPLGHIHPYYSIIIS